MVPSLFPILLPVASLLQAVDISDRIFSYFKRNSSLVGKHAFENRNYLPVSIKCNISFAKRLGLIFINLYLLLRVKGTAMKTTNMPIKWG